ncbi:MAG: phosphatase PAP2 family protein, partial [Paraprevotella sp.]|nr:phosphatase PAP2 family protein [Paraprevotella sp.]
LPAPGDSEGFFYNLVGNAQASGERPTAAFPSSHIGISGILMILAFRSSRKLAWVMMPFFVLLCCATVYIQAHYLIDAIAGIVSVPLVYMCSKGIYQIVFERKK